jgi:hypothetical protein
VNTFAATHRRVPRVALIGIVAVIAAFAALMAVRAGVFDSSSDSVTVPTAPRPASTPSTPGRTATPKIVLLPGLPAPLASKLRYSKVVVVSLYTGTAPGDRPAVGEARAGAREAGAGFVAINVVDNRRAEELAKFIGPVSSPAMLVVKRPGKIVTRMPGTVDSTVVAQAAHNAGARRG